MGSRRARPPGDAGAAATVEPGPGPVLLENVYPCTWCGAMVDLAQPQAGWIIEKYPTEPGQLPVVLCFECDLPEFDPVKAKRRAARTAWLTRGWRP